MVTRNPELDDAEKRDIAATIARGALRYFMIKYTKNKVIAFDFDEALAFDGDSGPYLQYAAGARRQNPREAERDRRGHGAVHPERAVRGGRSRRGGGRLGGSSSALPSSRPSSIRSYAPKSRPTWPVSR